MVQGPPDPYKNTRDEWTQKFLSIPLPDFPVAAEWKNLTIKLRTLFEKLAYHDAMQPNLQQTYMTPANSKNRVYFMWDFIGRTLGNIYNVDPTLPDDMPEAEQDEWNDVRGRSMYAGMLMTDEVPGKLNAMQESCYPKQKGKHPEFGEEILALAKSLYEGVGEEDAIKIYTKGHVNGLGPGDFARAIARGKAMGQVGE